MLYADGNKCVGLQEGDDSDAEAADKLMTSHPDADTTIIFMTGEGWSASFHHLQHFTDCICWGNKLMCHKLKHKIEYEILSCFCFMWWRMRRLLHYSLLYLIFICVHHIFRVSCQWDREVPGGFHQQGESGVHRSVVGGVFPLPPRLPVLHSKCKWSKKPPSNITAASHFTCRAKSF